MTASSTPRPTRALYREYVSPVRDSAVGQRVLEAVVTDTDIESALRTAPSVGEAANRLVDLANERDGTDNISVIVGTGSDLPSAPATTGGLPARAHTPASTLEARETCVRDDD